MDYFLSVKFTHTTASTFFIYVVLNFLNIFSLSHPEFSVKFLGQYNVVWGKMLVPQLKIVAMLIYIIKMGIRLLPNTILSCWHLI